SAAAATRRMPRRSELIARRRDSRGRAHATQLPQPRGPAGPVARQALARPPERMEAPEEPRAALAAVDVHGAGLAEADERGRPGRSTRPDAQPARQPAEERPVAGLGPVQPPRPRVRGLVEKRVTLLVAGEVARDRDVVRRAVLDVAARQLAAREANAR